MLAEKVGDKTGAWFGANSVTGNVVCVQANSTTWLTGFTFGPLLGIFFQQRQFSKWKATLKVSRIHCRRRRRRRRRRSNSQRDRSQRSSEL
jgi:hypothetical protein